MSVGMENLWQREVEATCEDCARGGIDRQTAWRELTVRLGMDSDEAMHWLDAAKEEAE